MRSALPNQKFYALNKDQHLSERYSLVEGGVAVYVSTHFQIGNSDLLHYHDDPHLTFIVNGGVVDKRKRREAELLPGEIMFFQSGESHQTITRLFPTKYISLQFNPDFIKKNTISESAIKDAVEKTPDAKFNVLKIYKELALNDEFSDGAIEMLLLDLTNGRNGVVSSYPGWLKKVAELLNDNWNQNISLSDLGIAAGVHPKTISKYFPRYFGCTLGEYRRRLKIERSLPLIKASHNSLTEIAHQCDFFDQSHFTRTFREVTGFLPKQFQKL